MKALRILLVEDDCLIGMLLAELLVEMGHQVYPVEATQAGAVTAALRHAPDLMIVDVQLDEGNGISAVGEAIRSKFIPHLFISGDIAKVLAVRPRAVVLQKPFREPELARAIHRALGSLDANYANHAANDANGSG
jgi:CheY-like chemotaxis protein